MSTYPLVQFVSDSAAGATVRFDFNNAAAGAAQTWVDHDSWNPGSPTLEGDPDAIGVDYGYRQLAFTLVVRGTKAQALTAMSSLSRELLRQDNWLLFQLSASSKPVWFRTYRTAPGSLDFQYVQDTSDSSSDLWTIGVTLDAGPFAYGARETLPAVTITNDPSTGTNPCSYWLPAIKGDAPAPLVAQASTGTPGQLGLLAVTSLPSQPSGYVAPFRIPETSAVNWITGTDTTTATSDAAYIGSSSRVVSFATNAGLVTRLSGTNLTSYSGGSALALLPGSYRAFLRVGFDTMPSTFQVRLGQESGGAGSYVWNDTATVSPVSAATYKQYVDLGIVTHPLGNPVPEGGRYASYTLIGGPSLAIQASRPSGSGQLFLDDLILVPASLNDSETTMALVTLGSTLSGNVPTIIYDGEAERVIMLPAANQFGPQNQATQVTGGFPTVTPGAANLLHYLRTMTTDTLTNSTSLTLSYQPRWLYLGAS